jgi:hypothetical protein
VQIFHSPREIDQGANQGASSAIIAKDQGKTPAPAGANEVFFASFLFTRKKGFFVYFLGHKKVNLCSKR